MAVRPTSKTPAVPAPGGTGGGASDPAPSLVPHGAHAGKPALPLHRPLILIGSRQRAHVHLISNSVSRVHSVIVNTDHGSYIRDLASRTGTIVNGRQVKEAGLRHGDTIQVGSFQFKFADPTGRGPLAAAIRAPAAVLYVQGREELVAIEGRTVLVGQRDTCDIALRSTAVSTAHAIIFELNGRHFVRDLGSRTGTYINGRQIHQEALEAGDMVRIGETAIRYASAALAEAVDVAEDEQDAFAPAEAAPVTLPVAAVVQPSEPQQEPFEDLAFATEVVGAAAAKPPEPTEAPIAGEQPTPVPITGTVGDVDSEPVAVEPVALEPGTLEPLPLEPLPLEPLPLESTSAEPEPPAEAPEERLPAEAPAADTTATTHADFDVDSIPLAGADDAPPLPVDLTAQPQEEQDATLEDMFGPEIPLSDVNLPLDDGSDRASGQAADATAPIPLDEPTLPLNDPEPAVTEAESLAPLPSTDEGAPSPQGRDETAAYDPDIDFNAEPDSVTAALNEPFGPLTDLSLNLPPEPDQEAAAERRSSLDDIDLVPAAEDLPPSAPPSADLQNESAPQEPAPPLTAAATLDEVELPPVLGDDLVLPPLQPAEPIASADLLATADAGPEPEGATATDSEPAGASPAAPEPDPAPASETVATFDPVVPEAPELPGAADLEPTSAHLEPPPQQPEIAAALDETPAAEPAVETPVAPEAPAAPAAEVSATIPADIDLDALADVTPAEAGAPPVPPVDEPVAPPVDQPVAVAPEAPPAEPEEPAVSDARVVTPLSPPPKKRGGRKPAAKKSAPPAPAPPAEPKKRRPWGKKAKEAAAAEQAAAAAAAAAASAAAATAAEATAAAATSNTPTAAEPAAFEPAAPQPAGPQPVDIAVAVDEPTAPAAEPAAEAPPEGPGPAEVTSGAAAVEQPPASVADVVTDATPSADPVADAAEPTLPALADDALSPDGEASASAAETSAETRAEALAETPAETLAATEPSPESAQELETGLADVEARTDLTGGGLADDVSMTSSEVPLDLPPSDPAFDAMIDDFVGPSTGPIVEQREEPAPGEPAAVADADTATPGPSNAAVYDVPPQEPPPQHSVVHEAAAPDLSVAEAAPPHDEPPLDLSVTIPDDVQPALAPAEPVPVSDTDIETAPAAPGERHETRVDEVPAPASEAPALPPSPPEPPAVQEPPPRHAPLFDPFMGMGRDAGSFIGGLPLDLSGPNLSGRDLSPPDVSVPDPFAMGAARAAPPQHAPAEPELPASEQQAAPAPRPEPTYGALDAPSDDFAPPSFDAGPGLDPLVVPQDAKGAPPPQAATSDLTLDDLDLDLSLPDLSVPELSTQEAPPAAPAPGAPATFTPTTATAPEGLLSAGALDLPELDAPLELPPAGPVPGPVPPKADDDIDPLLFTEAEAPTLQMLPTPEAPPQKPPLSDRGTARGGGQVPPPMPQTAQPAARGPAKPTPTKYPSKPPPPARASTPRRAAPRAPFDVDPGTLGAGLGIPAAGAGAPVKGGAPGAHIFDGLAAPPVREADVFSGLPLGADDAVLGGSSAAGPRKAVKRGRPGEGAAPRGTKRDNVGAFGAGAPAAAPLAPLEPLPPLPPASRRGSRGAPAAPAAPLEESALSRVSPDEAVPPQTPPGMAPPTPALPYGSHGWADPAPAPQRRTGMGVWLVLMILAVAGTTAAIYFLAPRPTAEVVGTLQFERLRDLDELQRKQFEQQQREWLGRPDFRERAREVLLVSHDGVSPGFLGNDDAAVIEYDKIRNAAHVKDQSNSLTLPYRGKHPEHDRARMDALVRALYAVNEPRRDAADVRQAHYAKAQQDLAALAAQIEQAKKRAGELRGKAESLPDLQKRLQAAQAEDQKLRAAAADARRQVDRLRAELGQAQTLGAFGAGLNWSLTTLLIAPSTVPTTAAVPGPAIAPAADEEDAQLARWRERLAQVEASIAAAREQRAQHVGQMRRQADERQARQSRRQAGRVDPRRRPSDNAVLQKMEQELALKERHRNAALGGGLPKEAARLDGEIAELSARIAVGRELIAAGLPDAQAAEFQALINERLGAAAPGSGAVEAANAAGIDAGPEPAALREARERLEGEAADLRQRMETREAELAAARANRERDAAQRAEQAVALQDAAAEEPAGGNDVAGDASPAQAELEAPADGAAAAEKLRAELAAAEEREKQAAEAAAESERAVRQAQADLQDAQAAAGELDRAMADLQDLQGRHSKRRKEAELLQVELSRSIVPVKPGADAVTVSAVGEDRRYLWMLIANAGVVMLFGALMWRAAHGGGGPMIPDRENPFEAPVIGADVPRPPGTDPNHDDERPVTV